MRSSCHMKRIMAHTMCSGMLLGPNRRAPCLASSICRHALRDRCCVQFPALKLSYQMFSVQCMCRVHELAPEDVLRTPNGDLFVKAHKQVCRNAERMLQILSCQGHI